MRSDDFAFDVALSFAGENRDVVEELASLLVRDNVRVFYDSYEMANLWGKDLYQHLQGVYRDQARYCIIFVSEPYAQKVWTRHELKQAQARAFRENREYILPVRLDDTEVHGLNATTGYFDLRQHSVKELRGVILEKLFGSAFVEDRLPELTWDGNLIEFRGQQVMSTWPAYLASQQARDKYIVKIPRIRYGDETGDGFSADVTCHDCGAVRGEYHASGCDVEQCPVCSGQALGCECIVDPDAV